MSFASPPRPDQSRPRQFRKTLAGAALALGLGAAALAPIQVASSAPVSEPTDGVYDVLGKSWGVSASDAKLRLDAEQRKAAGLEAAQAQLAKASRAAKAE